MEQKEPKHAKLSAGPKYADLPEIEDYERPELEKFEKPEFEKLKRVCTTITSFVYFSVEFTLRRNAGERDLFKKHQRKMNSNNRSATLSSAKFSVLFCVC